MNNFTRLSTYDFLAMLAPGYVILKFLNFVEIDSDCWINGFIIAILSYITGLCYHKIIEFIVTIMHLRKCECMLKKSYEKVAGKKGNMMKSISNYGDEYDLAYYYIAEKNSLLSIPVLETQEVFLRNAIPLLFLGIVFVGCHPCAENSAGICILLAVLFVSSVFCWVNICKKIYELVWDTYFSLKTVENEKNNLWHVVYTHRRIWRRSRIQQR